MSQADEVPPGPADGSDAGVFIVVAPDPRDELPVDWEAPDPEENDRGGRDNLLDWVSLAFETGYEGVYLPELAAEVGVLAYEDTESLPASRFPRLTVEIAARDAEPDEPPETEEVVFDGDLLATLLELYVLDGWAALVAVEQALDAKLAKVPDPREGGGTVPSQWRPARWLFRLARNAVGQVVRQELVALERLSAVRIDAHLAESQTRFAVAAGALPFETVTRQVGPPPSSPSPRGGTFTSTARQLVNRPLAETIFDAMTQAVTQRAALDTALSRLEEFRAAVAASPGRTAALAAGTSSPLGDALERGRQALEDSVRQAKALASGSLAQLARNQPLALLILDALSPGFYQPQMETLLDVQIESLRTDLATVEKAVDPQQSRLAELAPGVDPSTTAPVWPALLALDPPQGGIEAMVVEAAIRALGGGDAAWFPLLSERTLHELTGGGVIDRDGLGFAVYAHYAELVSIAVDAQEAQERAAQAFWSTFSRMAAAASLAALLTPKTVLAAPFLRLAAGLGDLALVLHSIHSLTRELNRLARLRGMAIAEEGLTAALFGELGDLVAVRNDLLEGLAIEAVIQLVGSLAGGQSALVRRTLLMRSYYLDLETLLGDG